MKPITIVGVVAVLVAGGVWWFAGHGSQPGTPAMVESAAGGPGSSDVSQTQPSTPATPATPSTAATAAPMSATVTYTAQGFSPKSVTVAKGGTVTFVNQSGERMWVASDPHPTHQGYAGTTRAQHCPDTAGVAFDQCTSGDSYSFMFTKSGTWGYHNHANAGDFGTVIVQ